MGRQPVADNNKTEEILNIPAPSEDRDRDVDFEFRDIGELDWSGKTITKNVTFRECRFLGEVRFEDTSFLQSVVFRNCTFKKKIIINNSRFGPLEDDNENHEKEDKVDIKIDFSSSTFLDDFSMKNTDIERTIHFDRSVFQGTARFEGSFFSQIAYFREIIFHQKASFENTRFRSFVSFKQSMFHKEFTMDHADFEKNSQFHNIVVQGRCSAIEAQFNSLSKKGKKTDSIYDSYAVFSNSKFEDVVDFTEALFGATSRFVLCVFNQEVRFPSAKFYGYTSFDRARFHSIIIFQGAHFFGSATLHLKDARISRIEVNYKELETYLHCLNLDRYESRLRKRISQLKKAIKDGRNFPSDVRTLEKLEEALEDPRKAILGEGSRTLAVLHKAFNDNFDSKGEDWAYVRLRRLEREALDQNQIFRRAWSRFLDMTCGYGTSPGKVALSAVLTIVLFALIYLFSPSAFEGSMSIREALTFSFRTFSSSELDSQISPSGMIEWLVMFESVLGYVVMMLLVITLSRLVIRS